MDAELKKHLDAWSKTGALTAVNKVVAEYGLRSLEQFINSTEGRDAHVLVGAVQRHLEAKKPPEEAARLALKEITGRDAQAFKAIIDDSYNQYVQIIERVVAEAGLQGDDAFWKDFATRLQQRQQQHPEESWEQAAKATVALFKKK